MASFSYGDEDDMQALSALLEPNFGGLEGGNGQAMVGSLFKVDMSGLESQIQALMQEVRECVPALERQCWGKV
jgi:hypothetical protein